MKGSNMIKICSILILISGIFSVIAGGVGFLAMSFVAAFGGPVILLVLGCILVILSGVLSIKAGSTGIKNCANPAMANTLIRWGILIMGMSLLGNIFQAAANESFDLSTVWKLLGGLLIPGLYTYGAWQLLSSTGQKFSFGGRAPLQQGQPQQPVPPQTPQMNYQQPMQGQPQQPVPPQTPQMNYQQPMQGQAQQPVPPQTPQMNYQQPMQGQPQQAVPPQMNYQQPMQGQPQQPVPPQTPQMNYQQPMQGQPQQAVPPQTPQMNYQQPMQGQPQQPAQSIQPAQPQTPVQQADGSWVCPRCGFTNKTGKFCTNCGAPKN